MTSVVSGTAVGCHGTTCEVLRITSTDGREKRGEDGAFEFERKIKEMRRDMRIRTSLPVGGDGAMSSTCIVASGEHHQPTSLRDKHVQIRVSIFTGQSYQSSQTWNTFS